MTDLSIAERFLASTQFGVRIKDGKVFDVMTRSTITRLKSTSQMLGEYADLLNQHGPHSQQAADYVALHADDAEFVELAVLARRLKVALAETQHGQ